MTLGICFGVKVAIHSLIHHKTVKHSQAPSNIRRTQIHTNTRTRTQIHTRMHAHTRPLPYECSAGSERVNCDACLFQLNDHLQEVEDEAMTKAVELEKQLSEANTELEELRVHTHSSAFLLSSAGCLGINPFLTGYNFRRNSQTASTIGLRL